MASDFDAFLSGKGAAPAAEQEATPAAAPDSTAQGGSGGVSGYVPPILQAVGAGGLQGLRDIGQTVTGLTSKVGIGTGLNADLAAATQAFRERYGSSWPAWLAEQATGIAATAPLTGGIGSALGGAARAAVPLAARWLGPMVEGAIAGGGTNALMSGGEGQNPLTAAATGAVGGGLIGGGLGLLAGKVTASPAVQAAAQRLGISLTTGEQAGGFLKGVEDATAPLPFSGAGQLATQRNAQIADVLGRNAGMGTGVSRIDTPMLENARQAVGNRIGQIASQFDIPYDHGLANDFGQILSDSHMAGPDTAQAQWARNLIDQADNLATAQGKTGAPGITGQEFASFIAHNSSLDKALNYTGQNALEVKQVAGDIRQALIDAAQRSPNTPQGALDALRDARYNYKVIKTIEPIIQKTPDGTETMSLGPLATSIGRNFKSTIAQPGDMQDLYQLLNGPLQAMRSSGTAERSMMQRIIGMGPGAGIGGGGLLWALGHPGAAEAAALSAGVPALGGGLLGRAMRLGPDMGGKGVWGPWARYRGFTNPLMPRAAGPMVGNMLIGGQQQGSPQ